MPVADPLTMRMTNFDPLPVHAHAQETRVCQSLCLQQDLQNRENMHHLHEELSDVLGIRCSSLAVGGPKTWSRIEGVLFGPLVMPYICLPTLFRGDGSWVHVFYRLDTSYPTTRINNSAWKALGAARIPSAAIININGHRTEVRTCSSDEDTSVIGADFLAGMGAAVCIDYNKRVFTISRDG